MRYNNSMNVKNMKAKQVNRNPAAKAWWAGLTALALAGAALWLHAGQADKPKKTQIILISVDTLRGDHLNSYGYARETAPYLAKLIQDSVYYREAYLNGCWTIPSHVSMLTGTLPSRHGVNMGWAFLPGWTVKKPGRSIRFLAEILQSRKVHTQKFAKLSPEYGFDRGFDGKENIDPFLSNLRFKKVQDYLESSKGKDFFLFIHTWMVHSPYANTHFLTKGKIDAGTRHRIDHFRRLYGEGGDTSNVFAAMLKENRLFNAQDCISLYDGGIRYADRYIGRIISLAKRLGIYQNLMVIVTSDHGEHFSERFPNQFYNCHGRDFTEEFIRVPLIIKYPGGRVTGSLDDAVSLIDIVPTILDRFGFEIPPYVQGRSLLRKDPREGAVIRVAESIHENLSEKKMIRSGDMKYIVTMDEVSGNAKANWDKISQRRLFDLANDPGETRNLYDDPRYRNLCIDLERRLKEIIRRSANPRFAAESTRVSEETLKQMKALGYLSRPALEFILMIGSRSCDWLQLGWSSQFQLGQHGVHLVQVETAAQGEAHQPAALLVRILALELFGFFHHQFSELFRKSAIFDLLKNRFQDIRGDMLGAQHEHDLPFPPAVEAELVLHVSAGEALVVEETVALKAIDYGGSLSISQFPGLEFFQQVGGAGFTAGAESCRPFVGPLLLRCEFHMRIGFPLDGFSK